LIFFDLLSDFSLSPLAIYYIKLNIYRKSNIIFGKSFLDIYFCPFLKNENTFTKKKYVKIRENAETIKKIKVSPSKKVFKICDDKFFTHKL
jgi:hypothetical protein